MKPLIPSRFRPVLLFLTASCVAWLVVGWLRHSAPPASPQAAVPALSPSYGQIPLSFEANQGQAKDPVRFLARGTNATLYLTPTEAALELRAATPTTDHQPPTTTLVKWSSPAGHKTHAPL